MNAEEFKQTIKIQSTQHFAQLTDELTAKWIAEDAESFKYRLVPAETFAEYVVKNVPDADVIGLNALCEWYAGLPAAPIQAGTPCTIRLYTDEYPATIVDVKRNKSGQPVEVSVRKNVVNYGDEITNNLCGDVKVYTLRNNHVWIAKGDPTKGGLRLRIGYHNYYRDLEY